MPYIKDPSTGDTLHLKRESGVYPVKVEKHHKNMIMMQYDSFNRLFCEIGESGEYWKECDLYLIGDKINLN